MLYYFVINQLEHMNVVISGRSKGVPSNLIPYIMQVVVGKLKEKVNVFEVMTLIHTMERCTRLYSRSWQLAGMLPH